MYVLSYYLKEEFLQLSDAFVKSVRSNFLPFSLGLGEKTVPEAVSLMFVLPYYIANN